MGKILPKQLELVKKLYYQDCLSMKEIGIRLNVSLDAVCYFMRHNKLRRRSFAESNVVSFSKKKLSFSIPKRLSVKEEKLKMIGVVLYLCEGYKTQKSSGIDLANCDPEIIVAFVKFLRDIFHVDESRFRILLYCYSNQNQEKLISYWSKLTKIPKSQFSKPYVRTDFQIAKSSKMPYGLVHIRYSDKKLLEVMRGWITEFKKEFAPVV